MRSLAVLAFVVAMLAPPAWADAGYCAQETFQVNVNEGCVIYFEATGDRVSVTVCVAMDGEPFAGDVGVRFRWEDEASTRWNHGLITVDDGTSFCSVLIEEPTPGGTGTTGLLFVNTNAVGAWSVQLSFQTAEDQAA